MEQHELNNKKTIPIQIQTQTKMTEAQISSKLDQKAFENMGITRIAKKSPPKITERLLY
jgi:hypothetical protein